MFMVYVQNFYDICASTHTLLQIYITEEVP